MIEDKVFCVKINTKGKNPFNFCLGRDIVGIGWGLKHGNPNTIDEYERLRGDNNEKFDNDASLSRALNIFKELENGGLIWTISPDNEYYLCKTNGKYTYHGNEEEHINADIINCLDSEFYKIGPATIVPDEVVKNLNDKKCPTATTICDKRAVSSTFEIYNLICQKNK